MPARRHLDVRWLYGLAVIPLLTDLAEAGRLPDSPRAWLTELIGGVVIAALVRRVQRERQAVLTLARTDGLTGLWNRRTFTEVVSDECARARRSKQPLCLIYVDIDHFKAVNDRHGHGRGDEILQQVGAAIGQACRARLDHGFRLGGDEFAVLLPGSTGVQAEVVVARIRALREQLDAAWVATDLGLSTGIVAFDGAETPQDWVRRADAAMYQQKAARRRAPPQAPDIAFATRTARR
jgi:diguanylate cyclase (GGDEF)-like protein